MLRGIAIRWLCIDRRRKKALERISVSYKNTMTIPLLRWSRVSSKVTTSGEITLIVVEYK